MGMMLDDSEQKLFYKLVKEELASYGLKPKPKTSSEMAYLLLLKCSLDRIEGSVIRETKRKERINRTMLRIDEQLKQIEENEK